MAEDEQGVQLEKPMEISVRVEDENDNAPVCDESVFEVQENEPSGNEAPSTYTQALHQLKFMCEDQHTFLINFDQK